MFNILTDAIENALTVVGDLAEGEVPTKRQVAQLISDGVTVAVIAAATGFSVEVIEELLDD